MVNIKNVSFDKTVGSSRLEFDINGSEIDNIIVNTFRRTILTDIPIYAYTDFKFTKNNSVFHNNFLKNQIKNMPVWGIENKIDYYEKNDQKIELMEDMGATRLISKSNRFYFQGGYNSRDGDIGIIKRESICKF